MELMYKRTHGEDVREGFLREFDADFEITTDVDNPSNNFEITKTIPDSQEELLWKENEIATIVYVNGTEWGGEISGSTIDESKGTITYTGRTWRGMLSQDIIEPYTQGQTARDYKTVAAGTNIATALQALPMNPIISVQETTYTARAFTYNRYITTHEGATNMLKNTQANLRMKFAYDEDFGNVLLSVAPAEDRTSLIEISQDYDDRVKLEIKRDGNTPKHLICLGDGELAARTVIHLYADENWNITQTVIPGAYPVETYEYSGSEDLLTDGRKHFQELIDQHTKISVQVNGIDLNLSDIIAARERLTGEYVTAEINRIIWKCNDQRAYQTETFEYSTDVRTHSVESEGKA